MSPEIPVHTKKNILIVDDHAVFRQGLRDFIEREADLAVCGEAAGCAVALKLCGETHPQLVLIDLSLGGDSGLDLLKDINKQFPGTRMLALSMQDELLYAERVLRSGASGFVSKSTDPDQMMKAIRCVLDGGVYTSETVQQKMMQAVRPVRSGGHPVFNLSDRELTVFEQIGKGNGTADIAASMNLSVKTVETYRARIKTKLGLHGSAELMQHAVQWVLDKKI